METFEEYCKDFIVDNLVRTLSLIIWMRMLEQMSMVAIYQAL